MRCSKVQLWQTLATCLVVWLPFMAKAKTPAACKAYKNVKAFAQVPKTNNRIALVGAINSIQHIDPKLPQKETTKLVRLFGVMASENANSSQASFKRYLSHTLKHTIGYDNALQAARTSQLKPDSAKSYSKLVLKHIENDFSDPRMKSLIESDRKNLSRMIETEIKNTPIGSKHSSTESPHSRVHKERQDILSENKKLSRQLKDTNTKLKDVQKKISHQRKHFARELRQRINFSLSDQEKIKNPTTKNKIKDYSRSGMEKVIKEYDNAFKLAIHDLKMEERALSFKSKLFKNRMAKNNAARDILDNAFSQGQTSKGQLEKLLAQAQYQRKRARINGFHNRMVFKLDQHFQKNILHNPVYASLLSPRPHKIHSEIEKIKKERAKKLKNQKRKAVFGRTMRRLAVRLTPAGRAMDVLDVYYTLEPITRDIIKDIKMSTSKPGPNKTALRALNLIDEPNNNLVCGQLQQNPELSRYFLSLASAFKGKKIPTKLKAPTQATPIPGVR